MAGQIRNTLFDDKKSISKISLFICLLLHLLFLSKRIQAQDIILQEKIVGNAEVSAPGSITLSPGFHALSGSNFHAYIGPLQGTYSNTQIPATVATTPVSGSSGNNYIKEIVYREARTSVPTGSYKHSETINYFDGLGRPSQTILAGASPTGNDIIQPVLYDIYGREAVKTLPYTDTKTGAFRANVTEATVNTYYTSSTPSGIESDSRAYTSFVFDNSPLNRIVSQTGPGSDWATNNKSVNTAYLTNTESKPGWSVTGNFTYSQSNYSALTLMFIETTDEQGNSVREYRDKLGQVVLKESKLGTNWLRTAYVYDDFGLLRCVIPPEASGPEDINLCYYYLYDSRKRLIEKRLPGAGSVKMVYDTRDRLRCLQDANQAGLASPEWTFTKYDDLNRLVITGTISGIGNQSTVQAAVDASLLINETRNDQLSTYGYTCVSFPVTGGNILTATYYDNYTFRTGMGLNANLDSEGYDATSYNISTLKDPDPKGQVTGTMTRVLSDSQDASVVPKRTLYAMLYYDKYGHLLRSVSDNHINGRDVISNIYEDITYQLLQSKQQHFGYENITIEKWVEYDHAGRLLATRDKINDQPEITLYALAYNEVGEMITKYYHSNQNFGNRSFIQKADYMYNLRGWLTKINDPSLADNDLYGQAIYYNTTTGLGGLDNYSGLYNGNIVGLKWNIKNDKVRGYRFSYDDLSRFAEGIYAQEPGLNTNSGYNNESVSLYDKNGNIKALQRKFNNTTVDNLTYHYELKTNKISTISDAAGNGSGIDDYPGDSQTYTYDANGNMIHDGSKSLDVVYHSALNLPKNLDFGDNNRIYYHYTPSGTKLIKHNYVNAASSTTTHYIGNVVYDGSSLSYILTEEGRIVPFGTGSERKFIYEYNLKDHLGNNRVTFMGTSLYGAVDMVQSNSYYPFGLVMNQYNGNTSPSYLKNKYLYNGKEHQNDVFGSSSLNWYDYGARFYDPQIGRWHSVDLMAEKHYDFNPYNYVLNNPLLFIDPFGMDTTIYILDQATNPNNKREYTADVYIDIDGKVIGPYRGSSYPNNPKKHNTLKEGDHPYNNSTGHDGGTKKGLNILNGEGERKADGTQPGGMYQEMENVNVHSGVSPDDDPEGLGRQNRGSQGCPTIAPSDAESFFSNFDWSGTNGTTGNSSGTLSIQRGTTAHATKTALKIIQTGQNLNTRTNNNVRVPYRY